MAGELHIRRATAEDGRDLWSWRNDPESRRNSKSTRPVAWAEHRRWLAASLANSGIVIYVAAQGATKLGSVRFELVAADEHRWSVSVAVAPCARNRGFGRQILMLGCETMERLNGALVFDAEIRLQNSASQAVFRGCGFHRVEDGATPGFQLFRRRRPPLRT
jgi:RimJ/RimL family protein N-acetyltransferase